MKAWTLLAAVAAFAWPAVAAAQAVEQAAVEDLGHAAIPVAIWAPAEGTNLPLVVMSHGTGGGPAGHVDTARALAAAGFVVAAPMHPGDNVQDQSNVGQPDWIANRSRHVGRAIDFMLGQWAGRGRLSGRVGVFGFSAGATTALVAAGGTLDLQRVRTHCERRREFACALMATLAEGAPAPAYLHDARIAAAVAAAPGLGFAFVPGGLANVRAPVQLWVGSADETVPYPTNGDLVRQGLPSPPELHEVAGAAHLSFLAPCGPEAPPAICQDPAGFDRAAFHESFNRDVVAFFRRHLRGE